MKSKAQKDTGRAPKRQRPRFPDAYPLVGMFFHSFDLDTDGKRKHVAMQGHIEAAVTPTLYLVHTFGWLMGDPAWAHRLVPLDEMVTWFFYPDVETMRDSYEHGDAYPFRYRPEAKEADKTASPNGGAR